MFSGARASPNSGSAWTILVNFGHKVGAECERLTHYKVGSCGRGFSVE